MNTVGVPAKYCLSSSRAGPSPTNARRAPGTRSKMSCGKEEHRGWAEWVNGRQGRDQLLQVQDSRCTLQNALQGGLQGGQQDLGNPSPAG